MWTLKTVKIDRPPPSLRGGGSDLSSTSTCSSSRPGKGKGERLDKITISKVCAYVLRWGRLFGLKCSNDLKDSLSIFFDFGLGKAINTTQFC